MRDNATRGWSPVGRCQSTSRVRGDTLMTQPSRYAALGGVEPELVGLTGKALTRDVMRILRFVVQAAGWLHSILLLGRIVVDKISGHVF